MWIDGVDMLGEGRDFVFEGNDKRFVHVAVPYGLGIFCCADDRIFETLHVEVSYYGADR